MIGNNDTLTFTDDDVIIRTKFIHNAPETYIEKNYCPYFGGNHEQLVNKVDLDAHQEYNQIQDNKSKQKAVYAGP